METYDSREELKFPQEYDDGGNIVLDDFFFFDYFMLLNISEQNDWAPFSPATAVEMNSMDEPIFEEVFLKITCFSSFVFMPDLRKIPALLAKTVLMMNPKQKPATWHVWTRIDKDLKIRKISLCQEKSIGQDDSINGKWLNSTSNLILQLP